MIKKNLRRGDMLINGPAKNMAILVKQTKKYWHYYMSGKMCRISKKNLWQSIDLHDKEMHIKYGSSLSRRRDQKKDRTLDLHGVSHGDADEKIRMFFNFADLPVTVVTGHSSKMRQILFKILKEYNFKILKSVSSDTKFTIIE